MEVFILGILIGLVIIVIIYSSLKTRKIYSENLEMDFQNEELMKRIEKRLHQRGFKFKAIKKHYYFYSINDTKTKQILPRIRVYTKNINKYGLIINKEFGEIKENNELRRETLEFFYANSLKGMLIYNEKDDKLEIIKIRKSSPYLYLEILLLSLILLGIYLIYIKI